MDTPLLRFVEKNQVNLWTIFCNELKTNGQGALWIESFEDNVNVRFYKEDDIPHTEHQNTLKKILQMLKDNNIQQLMNEEKWILSMSPINANMLPYVPILFLIIKEDAHNTFFFGYPQSMKNEIQYTLIGNATKKQKVDSWTISATTHGEKYLNLCKKASINNDLFQNFKHHQDFMKINLQLANEEAYFSRIKKDDIELLQYIDKFSQNDKIGGELFNGNISCSTLRHINTIINLRKYFDICNIKNLNIVEFGGGYGGLCAVLSQIVLWDNYNFIEISQVEQLAKKYLYALNIKNLTFNKNSIRNYNLFISEYAFSELEEKAFDEYIKIIKADCIYLAMNIWDNVKKKKLWEKLTLIYNMIEMDEYPKTKWPNYLWIGYLKTNGK
jgi:hypothetical protein